MMSSTTNTTTSTSLQGLKSQKELQEKAEEINLVLLQPDVDLWKLRELALTEGGLVNDTLRKRAWPKLVGLHKYYKYKPHFYKPKPQTSELAIDEQGDAPKFEFDTSAMNFEMIDKKHSDDDSNLDFPNDSKNNPYHHLIAESMDAEQIQRDVARCTWHLLSGTQRSRRVQYRHKSRKKVSSILRKKQRRLANLINLTLVESYELAPSMEDRLRYYQGYHDVACIFLHALGGGNTKPENNTNTAYNSGDDNNNNTNNEEDKLGLELPARVLCQVSYSHFRDHLRSDFMSLQTALRVALFPLLAKLDRPVHDHLKDCDMEPFFCLSWVLTWFSHDIRDTELVKRLFDVFLCSHPLFSLYVAIAMLVHPINRRVILSTDCDFAALHQCLVMLPRNSCRVGWKRRCNGEGYVSDEEATQADDMTASTGMDSSTYWDHTTVEERSMSLATSASLGHSGSVVSSLQSFSVGPIMVEDSHDRVPFQELIDHGLAYMRRYPPRCLLKLAKAHFKEEWNIGQQVSNISLLQNPPTWSLASTAKADWVLKQRVRQDLGLKASSRKDRRKRLKYMQQLKSAEEEAMKKQPTEEATPLVDMEYLKANQKTLPVIAVGYGPDPPDPEKKKRKKQIRMAIVVAVAAIMVGMIYRQYRLRSSSSSPETPLITNVTCDSSSSSSSDHSPSPSVVNTSSAPSASPSAGDEITVSEEKFSLFRRKESQRKPKPGSRSKPVPESPSTVSSLDVSSSAKSSVSEGATTLSSGDVLVDQDISNSRTNASSIPAVDSDLPIGSSSPQHLTSSSSRTVVAMDSKTASNHEGLSKNPTLKVLSRATKSLIQIFHHFQSKIFIPLFRTFTSPENVLAGANVILIGTMGNGKKSKSQ